MRRPNNTTKLMAYGYADNLFPSRAERLQIETTRRLFMEDSDPNGAITEIRIVPGNKGWALDKLALDLMGAASVCPRTRSESWSAGPLSQKYRRARRSAG